MNLNLDSKNFKDQIALLKELTKHLESAAAICDSINGSSEQKTTTPSVVSRNGVVAHTFAPGSRKGNLDIAFEVLKEAGKPLHKNELLKLAQAKGSNLTNADTFSFYLKRDNRFVKGEPGHWTINKSQAVFV